MKHFKAKAKKGWRYTNGVEKDEVTVKVAIAENGDFFVNGKKADEVKRYEMFLNNEEKSFVVCFKKRVFYINTMEAQ